MKKGVLAYVFFALLLCSTFLPYQTFALGTNTLSDPITHYLIYPLSDVFLPLFLPSTPAAVVLNNPKKPPPSTTSKPVNITISPNTPLSREDIVSLINQTLSLYPKLPPIQYITNTYTRGGSTEGLANSLAQSLEKLSQNGTFTSPSITGGLTSDTATFTGPVSASYFSATDASATSTFAGGVRVGGALTVGTSTQTTAGILGTTASSWTAWALKPNIISAGYGNNALGVLIPGDPLNSSGYAFVAGGSESSNNITLYNAPSLSNTSTAPSRVFRALFPNNNFIIYGSTTIGSYAWGSGGSAKLEVVAGPNTPDAFHVVSGTADEGSYISNNGSLLYVGRSGRVGISTSTPSYALTIASSTVPQLSLSAGAGVAQWTFRNAGGNLYLSTTTVAGTATTSTPTLTILNNGNVGFGTSSPSTTITFGLNTDRTIKVEGNNGAGYPGKDLNVLAGDALNTTGSQFAANGGNLNLSAGGVYGYQWSAKASSSIQFSTAYTGSVGWGANAPIVNMILTGRGNLGISTTTPIAKLSVQGTAANASWAAEDLLDVALSNGSNVMRITSGGNVGISTTTPWRTLSVNGTVAMPSLVNDSTGYYVCLNTTTGQLATSTTACGASSLKYKENITDLSYGLKDLLKLRPVSFTYKSSYTPDRTKQVGFIAEEVDQVIPELVAHDSSGQIQGLDYPKFASVVVSAVKELNSKVDEMQKKFEEGTLKMHELVIDSLSSETVYVRDITAENANIKNLNIGGNICVDDTCVTKEQFKQMLIRSGVGAVQTAVTPSIVETSSTTESTSTPETTATSTPEEVSAATTTESSGN